ncbi:hypothetical protein GGF37_000976 [Kickxella alabastrina]|nr:hypothetical protein GGF37_000976 [Kickxella alabastrina]
MVSKIRISASSSQTYEVSRLDIPSYIEFRDGMLRDPSFGKRHYDGLHCYAENINNDTLEYCGVSLLDEKKHVVIKAQDFEPQTMKLMSLYEAKGRLEDYYTEGFHYAVVLSFNDLKICTDSLCRGNSEKLETIVKNFVDEMGLDVRGIWYDEGRQEGNIHFNIHVVNKLPIELLCLIMDVWKRKHGRYWIAYSYNVVLWRLYASRNEVMRRGLPYICKYIVFGHFDRFFLKNIRKDSSDGKSLVGAQLSSYNMINQEYLIHDISNRQYTNHWTYCYDYLSDDIQSLKERMDLPAATLKGMFKNFKFKYQIVEVIKEELDKLLDEKKMFVEMNEKERVENKSLTRQLEDLKL